MPNEGAILSTTCQSQHCRFFGHTGTWTIGLPTDRIDAMPACGQRLLYLRYQRIEHVLLMDGGSRMDAMEWNLSEVMPCICALTRYFSAKVPWLAYLSLHQAKPTC